MDSSTKSVFGGTGYVKQILSDVEIIDTIDEIDVNPYVRTYLRRTKSMITFYGGILRQKLVGESAQIQFIVEGSI